MRRGFGRVSWVDGGSPADAAGIRPGDAILAMGGYPVVDELDYRFLEGSGELELLLERDGTEVRLSITKDEDEPLGIGFEGSGCERIRQCTNKCVFCFVDQLPDDVRPTLRVKDDDYVHSFLNGNYITLTNVREVELDRILRLRFSPMFVSVHSTNPVLRAGILGNPKAGDVMAPLRKLVGGGIDVHAQLVLVPGLNDGEELVRSLGDLWELGEGLLSVAAVPVGLTGHRKGLPELRPYGPGQARGVLDIIQRFQDRARSKRGTGWVYASDEFMLKAGVPVPEAAYYDDYPQIDNGVGLVRQFLDGFDEELKGNPDRYLAPGLPRIEATIATGTSAAPIVRQAVETLPKESYAISVEAVANRFFGGAVTVAGLLTGSDLISGLKGRVKGGFVVIPDVCVKQGEGIFLDGLSPEMVGQALGVQIIPCPTTGAGLLRSLRKRLRKRSFAAIRMGSGVSNRPLI